MSMRGAGVVVLAAVAAIVLASCSAATGMTERADPLPSTVAQTSTSTTAVTTSQAGTSATTSSAASKSSAPTPPTSARIVPTVDPEVGGQVADALSAVKTEWTKLLPDGWSPPLAWHGNGLYDAARRDAYPRSWMQGPICNGEAVSANNASYCRPLDMFSLDLGFLALIRNVAGTPALVETIAHEFGHAAQQRLRQAGQANLIWPQTELQADCFAGAVVYEASGDGLIDVSSGDLEELYAFLAVISDNEPSFGPGEHGNQRQREMSFQLGQGDISSCFAPTGPPIEIAVSVPLPGYPIAEGEPHYSLIMPSGNIWCVVPADHIECTIKEFDFDGKCTRGDMPLVTLHADGPARQNSCGGRGILTDDLDPISYGQTIWLPPAMCTAELSGLTCTNDEEHGFTLARAGLRTF
jgi:hypothetical protein